MNFKLIYYTIKLYLGGIWLSFLRGPKGWALKITCFHLWMFPQYLWTHLWDWIWSVFKFVLGLVLYPWIEWLECPIYCGAILYATLGIIFATANEKLTLWRWDLIENRENRNVELLLMDHFKMSPSLPRNIW